MKTQTAPYQNLNETMLELVKKLQGMKNQKDNLDRDIDNSEVLRNKLTAKINSYVEELERINESLEQKQTVMNVYDKILTESDCAYNKIVKSTEALYQMVKTEEKKITVPKTSYGNNSGMK